MDTSSSRLVDACSERERRFPPRTVVSPLVGVFAFYLAYSVFFVGLVVHGRGDPAIGPYSLAYLCLLLAPASLYGVAFARTLFEGGVVR